MNLNPMKVAIAAAIFGLSQSSSSFAAVTASAEASVAVSQIQAIQPKFTPSKTAFDQAREFVKEQGVKQGWDAEREMYVQIGTAYFDNEDPAYDSTFVTKRSLASMQATLEAKAKIIEFINTKMSAIDQVTTPGTDLSAKFNKDIRMLEGKLNKQKEILAKLMAEVDAKEADKLSGVTIGDRMKALMDASIKKLDQTYSAKNISEEKREEFERAKKKYDEAIAGYEDLKAKLEETKGSIRKESSSTVETISQMPLFGATTVAQFESFDKKKESYNVTVVVMWGKKTERVARALLQGEDFPVPAGDQSIEDWVDSNNWSTSTGGRQFRDKDGTFHFVGIAAADAGETAMDREDAMGVAEQMAKKEVAMSLFADVMSHKKAQEAMQVRSGGNGKDTVQAGQSFAKTVQQSIEDRQIQGLQQRYGGFVEHPISGKEIYVAIYSLDNKSAKAAIWAEERNYLTAILDEKAQQEAKGRTDGYKDAVEAAKKDQTEYNNARAASSSDLKEKAASSAKSQEVVSEQVDAGVETPRRSRSGVFSGAGQSGGLNW